ncbi:MAG TPA: hypothetical protein VF199_12525 [Bacillales bacterium]
METALDEIKRSRDYYRKEIEKKERELEGLLAQVDTIRERLPKKQKVLDGLNDIIKRLEAENDG